MTIRFDDSLPTLAEILQNELGTEVLTSGVVLRDAVGRLAFFAATNLDPKVKARVSDRLQHDLGGYARTDRALIAADDPGADTILKESALRVSAGEYQIRLIDRRVAGADWLRSPAPLSAPPPRFVFASLKGGVGRSTALSVAAAHIASKGRRVLAIDLDMEAPGLGAMLLNEGTLPKFGLIDALVENGISGLDDQFIADLVAPSDLAQRHGRIDVVPVWGRRSLENPADILAKLARAYMEDVEADGEVASTLDQVRSLVDRLIKNTRYDAILLDSRAGLNETTAAAILGLGADVFLFGLDEPQTYQGYLALFAHLARLRLSEEVSVDWLERVTPVLGRASPDKESRSRFAEEFKALFLKSGLVQRSTAPAEVVPLPAGTFSNVPWSDEKEDSEFLELDDSALPEALIILEDERFHLFHPATRRDLLSERIYQSSYGLFLHRLDEAVQLGSGER